MHPTVTVACPKCGAEAGYKCFSKFGASLNYRYHVQREKAYGQVQLMKVPNVKRK